MKIVCLPLDERPCNALFPKLLCEDNPEIELTIPDISILGRKKIPAGFEKIRDFLLSACRDADALILSVDMLLYGGILPSRLHHLSPEILSERLGLIRRLKRENPDLKIYAFSLVMRCPSYTSDDEEPDYYGICGREIFLYGQNEHKFSLGLITEEEYCREKAELEPICGNYLADFTSRRAVNIGAVLEALDLYAEGLMEAFIIPQDDSAPYGYTAIDQQKVKEKTAARSLAVDIYPGADEVGMTLLAKALTDRKAYAPKICPVYPDPACRDVIPLYEDRAVPLSVAAQIKNAGAVISSAEDADILLFCNLPVGKMQEADDPEGASYDRRDLVAYVDLLRRYAAEGRRIAVADIAYANGGDRKLGKLLAKDPGFFSLAGYAGWNTSSNTLGTVICQSILHYFYNDTPAHRRFTAVRVYEDLSFDAFGRRYLFETLLPPIGYSKHKADGIRGICSRMTEDVINADMKENYPEVYRAYRITDCWLPWARMFEVGLRVTERKEDVL